MAAMKRAHIKGALVGVESVTAEGLKDVYKGFNLHGEALVERLQAFRTHGIHVLGSFIFGLPSDRPATFSDDGGPRRSRRRDLRAVRHADAVSRDGRLRAVGEGHGRVGAARRRHPGLAPLAHSAGPAAEGLHAPSGDGADEIRRRTQGVWDEFYSLPRIWRRARAVRTVKARLAFVLISKLYRQMYANTGIATDSARHERSVRIARLTAKACRRSVHRGAHARPASAAGRRVVARVPDGVTSPRSRPGCGRVARAGAAALTQSLECPALAAASPYGPGRLPCSARLL